jgi:HPt (histidine-containing phosphotransfer) domain-containing protein
VKENQNTFKKIVEALSSGDSKTAHRIAHNLKSSSSYLGKKKLEEAAAFLEYSLQTNPAGCTKEQIKVIEIELEKALREFEHLLKETEEKKPETINAEELAALFTELKPLLEKADFDAAGYVEKLQGITGLEELVQRIDDYDFEGALELLEKKMNLPATLD